MAVRHGRRHRRPACASGDAAGERRRRAASRRDRRARAEIHAFNLVTADAARERAAAIDAAVAGRRRSRSARRRAGRAQGQHVHARRPHHVLVEDPRRMEAAVRRHDRHQAAAGRRDPDRQDQSRRVRDGVEHRELGVRADAQPARSRAACRAGRRADRRRRSPPGSRRWRSAPTPAGRSASRRRCAVWSASSPRTDASAATAWSPSPAASTRSGRSRTPWPTPRAPCRSCAVTIRSTRRRSPSRCPTTRQCSTAASTACAIGRITDLPQGRRPRRRRAHRAGVRRARGGRGDDRRRRGAGLHVRPHRLLHHRPRRGVVEPGALRRRALRPAGRGARHQRHVRGDAHGRLRRRGAGAGSCSARTPCRPATTTPTTARRCASGA